MGSTRWDRKLVVGRGDDVIANLVYQPKPRTCRTLLLLGLAWLCRLLSRLARRSRERQRDRHCDDCEYRPAEASAYTLLVSDRISRSEIGRAPSLIRGATGGVECYTGLRDELKGLVGVEGKSFEVGPYAPEQFRRRAAFGQRFVEK